MAISDPNRWRLERLTREFDARRRVPALSAALASLPYPVSPELAGFAHGIAEGVVVFWRDVEAGYIDNWVRDGFVTRGRDRIPTLDEREHWVEPTAALGPSARREMEAGWDFTHGVTVRDAEFAAARLNVLTRLRRHSALGSVAALDLPVGGPFPKAIPLVRGEWVDAVAVALVEFGWRLEREGYVRLRALDPHPLAWHRFVPAGGDAADPRPLPAEDVERMFLEQLATNDFGPGRRRSIAGRCMISLSDCLSRSGWIGPRRSSGVVVETGLRHAAWNAWIREAGHSRLLGPAAVGMLRETGLAWSSTFRPVAERTERYAELRLREEAMTDVLDLGRIRAASNPVGWIFSEVQHGILQALFENQPQTADELAKSTGYSRRRLFARNGLNELVQANPPLVLKCPRPSGYRLAELPSSL